MLFIKIVPCFIAEHKDMHISHWTELNGYITICITYVGIHENIHKTWDVPFWFLPNKSGHNDNESIFIGREILIQYVPLSVRK